MAPILGPKNGHVFGTGNVEKCAHDVPCRQHLVPIFALPVEQVGRPPAR